VNPKIISYCVHCGEPCDRYVNCNNKHGCNKQHFCCEACEEESLGCCSAECTEVVAKLRSEAEAEA